MAGHLEGLLEEQGKTVHTATVRMEDRESVMQVLDDIKPTHVINCAGCTGRPNVDWCEDNKQATIRSNVVGTLNLTDCCFMRGIHITTMATGCKSELLGTREDTDLGQASIPMMRNIHAMDQASSKKTRPILMARSTQPQSPK